MWKKKTLEHTLAWFWRKSCSPSVWNSRTNEVLLVGLQPADPPALGLIWWPQVAHFCAHVSISYSVCYVSWLMMCCVSLCCDAHSSQSSGLSAYPDPCGRLNTSTNWGGRWRWGISAPFHLLCLLVSDGSAFVDNYQAGPFHGHGWTCPLLSDPPPHSY